MKIVYLVCALALVLGFQNCGNVRFNNGDGTGSSLGTGSPLSTELPALPPVVEVCGGVSCSLAPITQKPAVVTILMALGDEAESQLVVDGASSQLIAESVVRYASPATDPKILVVMDHGRGSESPEDTVYVKDVLLKRYRVTLIEEPANGLMPADTVGYDLIWFNNPGAPMSESTTRDTLLAFAGGVILQGDDLSWGRSFSNEALTGLKYLDNGASVTCDDGVTYKHDNNEGEKYRVTLDPAKIPGANAATLQFRYGNDIDNTEIARPDLEVVAYAQGGPAACSAKRPAIVRYIKN